MVPIVLYIFNKIQIYIKTQSAQTSTRNVFDTAVF